MQVAEDHTGSPLSVTASLTCFWIPLQSFNDFSGKTQGHNFNVHM